MQIQAVQCAEQWTLIDPSSKLEAFKGQEVSNSSECRAWNYTTFCKFNKHLKFIDFIHSGSVELIHTILKPPPT